MKSAPFQYHRPDTAEEAVALLAELGDDAKVLAGGQSLIPILAMRLAVFGHLVDIGRIDGLSTIERRGDTLWVGAAVTEAALETDPEVAASVPLLARVTPFIGHVQIRNRGTFGGSVAHADPAAEYPAVVRALDAELEVQSPRGVRRIPAADFFTGIWSTALEPDELLLGASFPIWTGRCGVAVEEFARRHGDYAIAGSVLAIEADDDGRVSRCAIGLIGMAYTPVKAVDAEQSLLGRRLDEIDPDEVGRAAVAGLDEVPSDLNGSAAYRTRIATTMTSRAWSAASAEVQGTATEDPHA